MATQIMKPAIPYAFVLAIGLLLSMSSTTLARKLLPAAFIAQSPEQVQWSEASKFCESQGARLPKINGKDRYEVDGESDIYSIDGFSSPRGKKMILYHSECFWTATKAKTEQLWSVFEKENGFMYSISGKDDVCYAFCVRK